MKERILKGWTFTRVLYVVLGSAVIINSIINHQWFGVLLGGYFASMGIFAFGCAAGNCFGGNCNAEPRQTNKTEMQDVNFEEVKNK
ncbi:MAG: hypothetical protein SGJ10_10510 [Bacteroidota bacterium]|nr:hypothetical protein [Bacteroidota bacterium]